MKACKPIMVCTPSAVKNMNIYPKQKPHQYNLLLKKKKQQCLLYSDLPYIAVTFKLLKMGSLLWKGLHSKIYLDKLLN